MTKPEENTMVTIPLSEYNRLKEYENETFYRLTRQDLINVLDTYDISLTDTEIDDCFDYLYLNFYLEDWMIDLNGWITGWLDGYE